MTVKQGGGPVIMLLCAVGLTAAYLQHAALADDAPTAQTLYEQAADELIERQLGLAQQTLESLIVEHPQSPYAELAIIPLCQIYVADQPQRVIETLDRWQPQLAESRAIQRLAPGALLQAKKLRLRAWLTDVEAVDRVARLEQLAAELECCALEPEIRALRIRLAAALACQHEQELDFDAARRWLQSACELFDHWDQEAHAADTLTIDGIPLERLRSELKMRLPLAEAYREFESGRVERCAQLLSSIELNGCTEAEQVPLRYLWMETLLKLDRREDARDHRQWLLDYMSRQTSPPDWAPTLAIRHAEALLRDKQYVAANAWLTKCLADFPAFPQKFELDFLLARCAIAQVDFMTAENSLCDALACGSADGEVKAKANWLLGELNFLRQRHAAAIDYYRKVLPEDAAPQWQSRACLQMAKCQELLGDHSAAIDSYRRLEQLHPDAESARVARWRLQLLLASAREQSLSEANQFPQ